jgi:hypothetical protein
MARFYSVQSAVDAARLAAGGEPWPTGLRRANLGPGLYAWAARDLVEEYLRLLSERGVAGLRIVVYEIDDVELALLDRIDLTRLSDDEATAWMDEYSHYGQARPHGKQYVIRNTDMGTEHYFAASIFGMLREAP